MSSGNPIAGKVGSFLLAVMLAVFIWLTATQDQDPINDQFIQLGVDFKGQPAESIRIQPQSTSVQVLNFPPG